MKNCRKMYASLVILLSLIKVIHQLDLNVSYTTSFQCLNGSYALIGGANLTLEYDFGCSYHDLESFHLYETVIFRHMFDYEKRKGQSFIKDEKKRLKSYEWTETGIKFTIQDIKKEMDLGIYLASVEKGSNSEDKRIKLDNFFDPPTEVRMTTPSEIENKVKIKRGFGEYLLEASAESYTAFSCSSVMITWVSSRNGIIMFCQAKDEKDTTICPLTLHESEMTAGDCIRLEVYATQYGVQSKKKAYNVCYKAGGSSSSGLLIGLVTVLLADAVFVIVAAVVMGAYFPE